jgi:alkylation response protein AidB-like acyl-CoA dehydrogenase
MSPVELPSNEDRELLRKSVRGFLAQHWPAHRALAYGADAEHMGKIWTGLAQQGLAALGSHRAEGGLQELCVVMEELGRAACPAPLLATFHANLVMSSQSAAQHLLEAVRKGNACLAFAFGTCDGDDHAGSARLLEGHLSGTLCFIEGAAQATHLLVVADGPILACVPMDSPGVQTTPTPGLADPSLSTVRLKQVAADTYPISAEQVADLNLLSRLALAARALGAAQRGFEMVVDYARERHQFGQPIGRFQAIQHKLANCLINLDGVRCTLANAAQTHDQGRADWRYFASACVAYASPALRQVSLETHHTFGGIGFSEEHEAPRHFRRTHADLTRHGGVRRAREEVAQHFLDRCLDFPDFDLGSAGNHFRQEVRAWYRKHWVEDAKQRYDATPLRDRHLNWHDPVFHSKLAQTGWLTLAWPRSAGGQERSPLEQLAFIEETCRVGAPGLNPAEIEAQAIIRFGTQEQKDFYLPRLARGDYHFCLGYSEPGAGSDLAALKTTAVRDGDEWVINGQKVWTTCGEHSDCMWLAARTDPQAKPAHAGISVFCLPMDLPGITIRPSMTLYGHTNCTEFFDNVRLPADALVGELNAGWKILTSALATERQIAVSFVSMGAYRLSLLNAHVRTARKANGQALKDDATVRERIASIAAEMEVTRQLALQCMMLSEQGKVPIHEAAIVKVLASEVTQRMGEAALDIAGTGAILGEGSEGAITNGAIEQYLRNSIMLVIAGGSNEIQRNLIAQRGLNLPR